MLFLNSQSLKSALPLPLINATPPCLEHERKRGERRKVRCATSRERGGAIARQRAPARVTYVLQPRSETVDAPGGDEARGVE